MRTRKEIEETAQEIGRAGDYLDNQILEVLLDIRDLLSEDETAKLARKTVEKYRQSLS